MRAVWRGKEGVVAFGAGENDAEPVARRSWMVETLSETSATRSIALAVGHGVNIYRRAASLWPAMYSASVTDHSVAAYRNNVTAARRTGMGRLVAHISSLVDLREGLDTETATDLCVALFSHTTFQRLVVDAGWSVLAFKTWLRGTLVEQLLRPDQVNQQELDFTFSEGTDG